MTDKVSLWKEAIVKFLDRERHSITLFEFTVNDLTYTGRKRRKPRLRFDAIAFNPFRVGTTSPIRVLEMKSSRRDFLSDKKWRGYVPYSSQFGFICRAGVILPHDLPKGIGLFYIEGAKIVKQAEWTVRTISKEHREAVTHRLHSRAVGLLYEKSLKGLVTI